ncbi:Gamma-aminobutyric acid receptor-associated protein-like 2 [Perkinsus chesapeaki]|uniref:Gamma-aminobutyric acid receptor-associated protein-like 2 n=1 Tax=Perkinsus chesapeaki TaxID=330153 RepID=A0A7J6MU09_PERCH|nr:Gamma-aminobutyric acid receptor-associated protein-like 2 [Perkinsus chesapeaki]
MIGPRLVLATRTLSLSGMLRGRAHVVAATSSRSFSSWWHKWVDGTNPEDWTRKATANFLRSQKIDPYILEQADLENWRRWFMTEVQYFAGDREAVPLKERIEKARELAASKHQAKLDKLRRHYPLEQDLWAKCFAQGEETEGFATALPWSCLMYPRKKN